MHTLKPQSEPLTNHPDGERTQRDAPASASPAPMLDSSVRVSLGFVSNLGGSQDFLNPNSVITPHGSDAQSSLCVPPSLVMPAKRKWSKKHSSCKRTVQYLLLHWMRQKRQCHFTTLTGSPLSNPKELRYHWQLLRRRIETYLAWPRGSVQYRCVDTEEGHGVLHIVLSLPIPPKAFWIDYSVIHGWWLELHGAVQFRTDEIGIGQDHAARLSTYIVSQYVGNQDLSIRTSGTRLPLKFTAISTHVRRLIFGVGGSASAGAYAMPEAAFLRSPEFAKPDSFATDEYKAVHRVWRSALWQLHRRVMADLLLTGTALLFGKQYSLVNGSIVKLSARLP
jgi:hypothetical protein